MPPSEPSLPVADRRRFRWRRLFQYRLRTLLIATTIIATGLGWWSWRATCQKRCADALLAKGAVVYYGELMMSTRDNVVPKPLRWLVAPDFYENITAVELAIRGPHQSNNKTLATSDLDLLAELDRLEELTIVADRTAEEREVLVPLDLKQIAKKCPQLKLLSLNGCSVAGKLSDLKPLSHLKHLELTDTDTNDRDLIDAAGLVSLKAFWVSGTEATEAGVATLRRTQPGLEVFFHPHVD